MFLVQFVSIILVGCILNSQAEWIKEKILGYQVIEEKCLSQGAPPLQDLLPDIEFFNSIATAVIEYKSPIVINAGRGTTGTREITAIFQKHGWSTIHFAMGVCQNPQFVECFRNNFQMLFQKLNIIKTTPPRCMTAQRGRELTASFLTKILSCGDCGPLLIGDSPWVNIFTELYLAVCAHATYDPKVIYSRRDPLAWSLSRSKHHQSCRACFLCSSNSVLDPFSYTQCGPKGMKNGYSAAVEEELAWLNRTARWSPEKVERQGIRSLPALGRAFDKYNKYVRALVPANRIIPLDLFDKSRKWKEMVSETMLYQLAKFNQS